MDDRQHFKNLIKKDANGEMLAAGKATFVEVKLIQTLLECQNRFSSSYLSLPLDHGIRWIFGYSNYINQSLLSEKPKLPFGHKYQKGSIVYVDFFGHFGHEIAFDHPAIVLAEVGNDLIVAPITSNQSIFENNIEYHIKLPKNIPELGDMPNDCTIKLEQIRFISKRRLLVNFKKRVSDIDKLKQIDMALIKILVNYTFEAKDKEHKKLIKQASKIIEDSLDYIEELSTENEGLIEENEALLKRVEELENNIDL